MEIVSFTQQHIPQFVPLFNQLFTSAPPYMPLSQEYCRRRIFDSILFDERYALVALEGKRAVGFVLGQGKKFPSDPKGQGAIISLVMVNPEFQRQAIARGLIQELERRFQERGIKAVRVGMGWFGFFGGVWERWTAALSLFRSLGYQEAGRGCFMMASLEGFSMPPELLEKEKDLGDMGIRVWPYSPSNCVALKDFLCREFGEGWYYETISKVEHGVEEFNGCNLIDVYAPDEVLLVLKGDEIIGFSVVQSMGKPIGIFGPVGLAGVYRKQGIGTVLLGRSLEILPKKGCRDVGLWTSAGGYQSERFYPKLGFSYSDVWMHFGKRF